MSEEKRQTMKGLQMVGRVAAFLGLALSVFTALGGWNASIRDTVRLSGEIGFPLPVWTAILFKPLVFWVLAFVFALLWFLCGSNPWRRARGLAWFPRVLSPLLLLGLLFLLLEGITGFNRQGEVFAAEAAALGYCESKRIDLPLACPPGEKMQEHSLVDGKAIWCGLPLRSAEEGKRAPSLQKLYESYLEAFEGAILVFDADGRIRSRACMWGGVPHGIWLDFDEAGRLKSEKHYFNGRLESE